MEHPMYLVWTRIAARMILCPENMSGLFKGNMTTYNACISWMKEGALPPRPTLQHMRTCETYSFLRKQHMGVELSKHDTNLMNSK